MKNDIPRVFGPPENLDDYLDVDVDVDVDPGFEIIRKSKKTGKKKVR